MGNLCASKPKLPALIESELQDIFRFFPAMRVAFVLRPDGSVISNFTCEAFETSIGIRGVRGPRGQVIPVLPEGTASTIEVLKKSSGSFGTALHHGESQIMHIRGKQQMFSYYAISDTSFSLVLYSELSSNSLDIPEMSKVDDEMAPVLAQITELIRNSEKR